MVLVDGAEARGVLGAFLLSILLTRDVLKGVLFLLRRHICLSILCLVKFSGHVD